MRRKSRGGGPVGSMSLSPPGVFLRRLGDIQGQTFEKLGGHHHGTSGNPSRS
jgi:hypothetical protein